MNEVELRIDGRQVPFNNVWVHLQDVSQQDSVEYRINVAGKYVRQVFDPYITKEAQTSWVDFISGLVTEFGTFIVGGFIDKMHAIVGKHELSYFWVIATLDEVIENENSIELRGQAVTFDPTRFPKRLYEVTTNE